MKPIFHNAVKGQGSRGKGQDISGVDAVILAGGLGTRMANVMPSTPKILAPIGGRPLLNIFVEQLRAHGVERIILCVGHLRDKVMEYVRTAAETDARFRNVLCSEETEPLGTGGALKNAEPLIRAEYVLVMNGDTIYDTDLSALHRFHEEKGGVVSIAAKLTDRRDAGRIRVSPDARITGFDERSSNMELPMNAGVYLMHRQAFGHMPQGAFSLEYDFFPKVVQALPCYAFLMEGDALDIGTPERYERAKQTYRS